MMVRLGVDCSRATGRSRVYPSVHFFTRQAAREKLAAMRALTEAARTRHLALAEDYRQRAEAMQGATQS